MDPAVLALWPLFLPHPDVVPRFEVKSEWDTGYYGEVTVTNHSDRVLDDWSLTVILPEAAEIRESWGVTIADPVASGPADNQEIALVVEPDGSQGDRLALGQSVTFGLTVDRAGGSSVEMTLEPERLASADPPMDPNRVFAPTWRGFNMGSWWIGTFNAPSSLRALEQLAEAGANVVSLVPTRYVATVDSADIFSNQQTETDENLIGMIRKAKSLGLKVVVKPHVHLEDFGLHQEIEPLDTERFFQEFTETLVHYATIAAEEDADLFVTAGELVSLTKPKYDRYWRDSIAAVRQVFPGPLTYAANWGEELQVTFWDALDYIGVDMYAPIFDGTEPTVEAAMDGWRNPPWHPVVKDLYGELPILEAMRRLSNFHGKPILFTEHGYRSIDGGGSGLMDDAEAPLDFEEQAIMYEAFFRILEETQPDWLAGILLWDWMAEETGLPGPVPDAEGFSLAGKPAQQVFTQWMGPDSAFAQTGVAAESSPQAQNDLPPAEQ